MEKNSSNIFAWGNRFIGLQFQTLAGGKSKLVHLNMLCNNKSFASIQANTFHSSAIACKHFIPSIINQMSWEPHQSKLRPSKGKVVPQLQAYTTSHWTNSTQWENNHTSYWHWVRSSIQKTPTWCHVMFEERQIWKEDKVPCSYGNDTTKLWKVKRSMHTEDEIWR